MRKQIVFLVLLILSMSMGVHAQTSVTIVDRTPAAGSLDVDSKTSITIVFSQPVVPLTGSAEEKSLPAPVIITPSIPGTGEWVNTVIWQFKPDSPFPINTTITVHTDDSFVSADGSSLAADQWQFTTGLSRATYVSVGKNDVWHSPEYVVEPDWSILLQFSQAFNKESAEQLIELHDAKGESVPVTFNWENSAEVIVDPVAQLAIAAEYTLVVNATLDGHQLLEEPFSQIIHTIPLPSVVRVSPEPDSKVSISPSHRASIQFATNMNLNSLRGLIQVEPETLEWEVQTNAHDLTNVYVNFKPVLDQTVTITLLAGAEDLYGNKIETDYSWSFEITEPPPPSLESYLALRDSFVVTNAYRENTRLAMVTRGAENFTSNLKLYHAGDIAAAMRAIPTDEDHYTSPLEFSTALLENADALRSWQQTFNGEGSSKVSEILLAGEDGVQLEPGLYILLADEYRSYGEPHVVTQRLVLAVSTAVLTVRRSPTETLVWVTDMKTGSPISNVAVTFHATDGTVTSATTNKNGIARVASAASTTPVSDCYYPQYCTSGDYAIITAEAPNVYGAWYSDRVSSPQATIGNLYTDRRVYRPGDPVYFRGVLRDKDDMTYTVPTMNKVAISLCGSYGCDQSESLQTITVPVSYWGTVNGSFTLPADAEPGLYRIVTDWGESAFTESDCYSYGFDQLSCDAIPSDGTQIVVATFDTPEFEMSATPVAPEGRQGEPFGVVVNAQLYSGSPLRGATVDWEVNAYEGTFRHEDYQFVDSTLKNTGYGSSSGTDKEIPPITTDANGAAIIPTERIVANVPLNVNMNVMVSEGAEKHASSVSFFLHPAAVYVGLRNKLGFVKQGDDITIDVIAVTPGHETVPQQHIIYTIEQLRQKQHTTDQYGYYYWETVVTSVSSDTLITGADGTATITFPAEATGKYRVRAVTTDEQGRSHSSIIEVQVGTEPRLPFQVPTYDDKRFTITNDQAVYQPGDSALLQIQTPESGMLLLTVERQNVQRAFVLTVNSTEPLIFELPLGYEDTPNIYITGTFVQGMLSPDDSPSYAIAKTSLIVKPIHRYLNVEVEASATQVAPGDSVTFNVRVTDERGIPIRAEVGLSLVDEAILSLAPTASPSLFDTFYSSQTNDVFSGISLRGLVDDLIDKLEPPGMGGGGGGDMGDIESSIDPRKDYVTTPLWLPSIVTDENGRASATLVMPDNLTRWRLDVRAVSLTTLVGQADLKIVSSLPFFVRPQTPRFLVAGDTVELAMIAHNETSAAQTVTASIQVDGVNLLDDTEKSVTLPPNSQQRIAWRALVNNVESVEVTFSAGNEVIWDAARPALSDNRIPVLKYVAPDTVATAGILDAAETRTEVIRPPDHALESQLNISLTSSLIDTAAATLDTYPPDQFETIDRLIGRLMINVALYRAGGHDSLAEAIERDIQQLDSLRVTANGDGWNWTGPNDYYWDVFTSGYAVIALTEASDVGFESADVVRAPTCSFVRNGVYSLPQASDSDAIFNRVAFAHWIEILCGRQYPNTDVLDHLFAFRERLSPAGKGFLLLSIAASDQEMTQTLVDDLLGMAITTATGLHWQGQNQSLWDTDTLTTAVVLRALTIKAPEKELLPNIVRWLTIARSGDRWATPLETGWSVTTLVDYALAFEGQTAPSYSLDVQLDADSVVDSMPAVGLREQLALPLNQDEHKLTIERSAGSGLLYYTATLQATLQAADAPPTTRGITVIREYMDKNGNPIDSVAVGDSVFVRLTVIAAYDTYYFVLDDPLPAGLIADDPSLIKTATDGIAVTRALSENNLRWFYGSSTFSRSVYGNTQVQFYASALPRGTYIVTYEARAGAAGEFQAMPTHAYSAVMPDIFGRSAGQVFSITVPSK